MDLRLPAGGTTTSRVKPKWEDVARAYIAVTIGFFLGYFAGFYLESPVGVRHAVDWMLFVVPLLLLVLLLRHRAMDRGVFVTRLIGAFVGWSIFVWQFYLSSSVQGSLGYWVMVTRSPVFITLAASLVAGLLVALGVLAGDTAWGWLRRRPLRPR